MLTHQSAVSKKVAASAIEEYLYKIFPQDLNSSNTMFGGKMMEILDKVASIVAERHSHKTCTTATATVRFLSPAKQGETLLFQASIHRSWRTSMEIGVRVFAKDYKQQEQRHVVSANFIFVALDDQAIPINVPQVIPETKEQIRRYHDAETRRIYRQKEMQCTEEKTLRT